MNKFKLLLKSPRIVIVLLLLLGALILINPALDDQGVAIRSIAKDSSAAKAGLASPQPADKPRMRDVITTFDGVKIKDLEHFQQLVENLDVGQVVPLIVKTHFTYDTNNKRKFSFRTHEEEFIIKVEPLVEIITLNETEEKTFEELQEVQKEINGSLVSVNETVNVTKQVPKTKENIIGKKELGLQVYAKPRTNLKKGLDLEGGTRVLLQPQKRVSEEDLNLIIDNLKQRLNVYGLSDLVVRSAGDFVSDTQYIVVEIAGANEQEVKDLIGKQGVFEARIGNVTAFKGGQDIKNVCRTPDCSFAVSPYRGCSSGDGGWACTFQFSITLSREAAERQAAATRNLEVLPGGTGGEGVLSQNIDFYLDNELVDSLTIAAGLKGNAETNIAISGPGSGKTELEARADSAKNMRKLQTILITGSLPVKLDVVKTDSISPLLGKEFIKNILFTGFVAILSVAVVLWIRYRQVTLSLTILFTMVSEIILTLGLAAAIGWNIDLAGIAGILVAVGTGVDDQIVITDETLRGSKERYLSWKDKFKKAFFIVLSAYIITVVGMLPLISAGAGLLRGFAITTILAISFGVFVTRPAFGVIIEKLLYDEEP
ncbi:PDZ domain-containing protein [Candidatus Woesearchaeota archaeon]|nr:PDZ domain-containing protein [Candidatus Woesearchaeota archaeon]